MEERKMRALIVDDEKIIRDFFSRLLSLQGVDVVLAEDGYKAVELAKETNFDIYFIDVRMPGINGLETFRKIKESRPDAVVVMMTGYAVEEVLAEAQKEGAFSALHKPFDISEIKGILDKVLSEKKGALNILVIDDDEAVLNFFSAFLKTKNQKYKVAHDKNEALALASKEKFDMVFLDLVLRDEGAMVYKEIKQLLPDASIIVITGYPQKAKELENAPEISGCLYKPFEIDGILDYIKSVKAKKQ